MTQRRLTIGFVLSLTVAGCAHVPPEPVADRGQAPTDFTRNAAPPETAALETAPVAADPPAAAERQSAPPAEPAEPQRPHDLWDRIRAGMRMEVRSEPRVEAELAFYASRPEYFARVADRAEPYLHFIVEELDKRGLPMELALLPVVESAFQPFAYSPGRAAGIWQFIPSTGLHYGLKQTWWYDGRRDVVASTRAALDYLERLYGHFSDWELALAAYNAGEGTVMRAIRANQRRGLATDFWNLKLPRETRAYVPRLLAVSALVADPGRYDVSLRSIPDEPYLTVVEVGSQIDLALAAELAELSVEDLYRLNPGFNRWATDPEGPHLLVVPIEVAERFELALAALPPERRVHWERHKIARGDTLSEIANRYHTTIEVLKQVNELRSSTIRAGQHLIVPVASKSAGHYALSASQRLAQTQDAQRSGRKRIHTVKSGDTLWDIARRYGTSTQALAKWNGMSPRDMIRPGQNLVVWTESPTGSVKSDNMMLAKASGGVAEPPAKIQQVRYTVRRGDSLYVIARKFNVTVNDLRRWNDLSKKRYLQPGQLLMVHVDVTDGSI